VQQTQLIHAFVTAIEKADPQALVITLGDLNDQGFEPAITTMERGGALADTVNRLPLAQRYDYVFDGDSETLSGLLVSPALNRLVTWAGPVHINADFAGQTSDHDPLLAYFNTPG
jgi:predicted extracellular nuclease